MLNSLWTRNIHLKNEMPKKNRKAFIYSRTDKSKVAEPDISAGLLFQALYLSTGYVTKKASIP